MSTPTIQEIEEKVISIVAEHLGRDPSELTRETSFVNDLNADSLDIVEVVMDLEETYDLNVPDEDAQKIDTVGAAITYIEQHLAHKAQGAPASGD